LARNFSCIGNQCDPFPKVENPKLKAAGSGCSPPVFQESDYGVPQKVVIDKSGTNLAGLQSVNMILKFTGTGEIIEIR